jgi:hypothetical protein
MGWCLWPLFTVCTQHKDEASNPNHTQVKVMIG